MHETHLFDAEIINVRLPRALAHEQLKAGHEQAVIARHDESVPPPDVSLPVEELVRCRARGGLIEQCRCHVVCSGHSVVREVAKEVLDVDVVPVHAERHRHVERIVRGTVDREEGCLRHAAVTCDGSSQGRGTDEERR